MNKWPRVQVSELCGLIVDCVNKTAPIVEQQTRYKMIRTTNIKNGRIDLADCRSVSRETFDKWTKRAKVLKGDILLTREAPMGEVGRVNFDDDVFLGQRIVQYRVNPEKVTSDYLLYSFLSPDLQYQFGRHEGGGSTVSHIRVPDCLKFQIPLPSLNEQKKIAAVLSALDAKIDLNNRINAELETLSKTIYDYWFVQFDFPDESGRPYKTGGGKMVYSTALKREIPEGWEVGSLDGLGEIVGGSTPSTADVANFGKDMIPWITPKDLSDNKGRKFIARGETDVSEKGKRNASLKLHPAGTVLMSSRAPVGYLAIALNPITTNQGFKSFVPSKDYGTAFVFYTVARLMPAIIQQASGSTFVEISGGVLKAIHSVLPPKGVANAFCLVLESILKRQKAAELENRELTQIRDWLLPMLMNGQVTVQS